jgi:hypothetical protein
MKSRFARIGVIVVILLACALMVGYFIGGNPSHNEAGGLFGDLIFVRPVLAAEGTSFLEQEAGMSLYLNAAQALDLAKAKGVYKTIESETSTYLIGSIALPGLPETDDMHCYVQKDGWIVVYYLRAEPVGKIIDWNYYSGSQLTSNKLKVGMSQMCDPLGLTPTYAKYYHFQFPYANGWMVITESQVQNGTDSFNLNIPSSYTVYERSWSHRSGTGRDTIIGSLTSAQLAPDVSHAVVAEVSGGCGYISCSFYGTLKIDGTTIDSINTDTYTTSSEVAILLVYRE